MNKAISRYLLISISYLVMFLWEPIAVLLMAGKISIPVAIGATCITYLISFKMRRRFLGKKADGIFIVNLIPAVTWLAFCRNGAPTASGMLFLLSAVLMLFGVIFDATQVKGDSTGENT